MAGPLEGVRVVELALDTSVVGAGMASCVPGKLLRDLGAHVTRVTSARRSTLDQGVELERPWNRGKDVVAVDDASVDLAEVVLPLLADADVLFATGPEHLVEGTGIEFSQLMRTNPRLVVVRVRPSFDAAGAQPDLDFLVEARAGVLTQICSHRGGPAFPDLQVGAAGAALGATVGALALLYEREATGVGGWAETSLVDGVFGLLPMIIGRVEHASPTTNLLWRDQGPAEALVYQCADGEWIQLWFGAKGAYEAFLEHVGDPPSAEGYNADLMSGAMVERGARWSAMFATQPRDYWLAELDGHDFRCEPAFRPGEALRDAHVREVGLAIDGGDGTTVLGPPLSVTPVSAQSSAARPAAEPTAGEPRRLLDGVRVLDLSAFLAGPIGPLVLAELGADVVKVEPVSGDVHRNMEPMFAAGQRGKRAVALDLKSADAPRVLDAMFRWADVVHQNSRVGLDARLGYDEATVRAANPDVVYSFASGFGDHGPRALLPTNDQLMQALSGIEAAQGGAGQSPTFLVWGAVDVAGGWLSACAMLAGLYARRRHGGGQSVRSSLLGAALTLKSGAFLAGAEIVGGPVLDADQRGYGAAYRLYQGGDGAWFALAVPDAAAWSRLRDATGLDALPSEPPPLRTTRTAATGLQPEEVLLAELFATKDAGAWVALLRAADVPVEPVPDADRTAFIARLLDDPVHRQLGRVATLTYGARGKLEQPALPLRFGPAPRPNARAVIPALGEQTDEFLASLGFDAEARAALATSGAIPPVASARA